MKYDDVHSFLIPKLRSDLPDFLSYHDVNHTLSVIKAASYLANAENLTEDQTTLIKTAALFHDAGFLENPTSEGHEKRSCEMAARALPNYEYSEPQILEICGLIMATHLPQKPKTKLESLLCDADLFYLGTPQYTQLAEKLKRELMHEKRLKSEENWYNLQMNFLEEHSYFTQTARKELEMIKNKNLEALQAKNKKLTPLTNNHWAETIYDFFFMLAGVLLAAVALKGFLVPNHFFDGGVTGLSLLLHELYHLNLGIIILLLNLPLIAVGYFSVGRKFALRTFLAVVMLGIVLTFMPEFDLTHDKLLISIFGGVFLGLGVGLNMRTGAALDGIEVLALYTLKRTSFTITEIILGINIIIFSIAAFKFGIETALYSILTYFAASRTIDYVVEGLQAFTGVTIISAESEMIKYQLVNNLKRGITVYKGERGFLPENFEISSKCDIIFTVITRLELRKLKNLVHDVDPNAFVFANTIKEASGGIISRKQHH
jgi:uncharacterized membrane-anchored protein YitT (DUF2179 family)